MPEYQVHGLFSLTIKQFQMKSIKYFSIFNCMMLLFASSCNTVDPQQSTPLDSVELTPRSVDCEDCPVEDCCCEIELVTGSSVIIDLCGPTGPFLSTSPCGPIDAGNCFTIEGFYMGPITLNDPDEPLLFCMAQNSSFVINTTNGNAFVRITCQKGMSMPQTFPLQLVGPNRYYFTVNGDCEVEDCG